VCRVTLEEQRGCKVLELSLAEVELRGAYFWNSPTSMALQLMQFSFSMLYPQKVSWENTFKWIPPNTLKRILKVFNGSILPLLYWRDVFQWKIQIWMREKISRFKFIKDNHHSYLIFILLWHFELNPKPFPSSHVDLLPFE